TNLSYPYRKFKYKMGIQSLLLTLKSIQTKISISKYAGNTVGVDAYCWLHKGIHSCLFELVWNKPTTKYVEYCMRRVRMLKEFNVQPFIVFDGGYLPAKYHTEQIRERKRQEYRKIGQELYKKGRFHESFQFFKKSALRAENVAYVVAPYEADAQLAYLEKKKYISAIITEDSDLLVFGCRNVIYKLDSNGEGIEICRDKFGDVQEINMLGWMDKNFRHMSMLAGCDYLPSITGIGLKSAHKYLRKYKTVEKVIQHLKNNKKTKVPPNYENDFKRAELAFLYQRVFDIETERLVTLNPIPKDLNISPNTDYIGPNIDEKIALGIAVGDINPITVKPMIQVGKEVAIMRVSSPFNNDCREKGLFLSSENDPFTCNPFNSNYNYSVANLVNLPLFERPRKNKKMRGRDSISTASKKRRICSNTNNILSSNSSTLSYNQPWSKMFEMEVNEDKESRQSAQKLNILIRCEEIFSTINLDRMKQSDQYYHVGLTEGWRNKYLRKRKWDNKYEE
ncbi:19632_t:CDS:2, partial [Funneliformis geosporum]